MILVNLQRLLIAILIFILISTSIHAQNVFPATGSAGIGTTSPTSALDILGGNFHTTNNTQTIPANNAGGGLTVNWNRSNGSAEVNLWNVYNGAGTSFLFSQKTGTSTYSDLFTIMGNANTGIGIVPQNKLDVLTSTANDGINLRYSTTGFVRLAANSLGAGAYNVLTQAGDAGIIYGGTSSGSGTFGFVISPWSAGPTGLRVDNNGNVGIATANTQGYQLAVNGSAIFTKAVVKLYANWPDYVFKKTYMLPSLKSLEMFIKVNNHLPDMPDENEVQKNGIDMGAMQTILVKKVEELTLYIIEQQKQLEKQNKKLEQLEEKLERTRQ